LEIALRVPETETIFTLSPYTVSPCAGLITLR